MKNRKLLLVVSLLLALTISLTGTLAYLTDTDSDVNVMTLGNVDIEQWENGKVDGFDQGQALYPAYYTENEYQAGLAVTGAIEKRVNVNNVGKSPAYVRTVFAFEAGELTKAEFEKNIHLDWNIDETSLNWADTSVDIKGEKYFLAWYTYPTAIAAGTQAGETLLRVVMDKTADNDVMTKLGDSDYNILVVTQAIQTENMPDAETALDAGFGVLSADSHPWMDWNGQGDDEGDQDPDDYLVVASPDELKDAMLVRGAHIMLAEDITVDKDTPLQWGAYMFVANGREVTIDLNGKNIIVEEDAFVRANALFTTANKGTLNIVGEGTIEVKNTKAGIFHAMNSGDQINVYSGTFISKSNNGSDALALIYTNSGHVDVYGGKFVSPEGVEVANAEDRQGNKLFTVFHEGALLSHKLYQKGDSTRIKLQAGCELREVVIDGETWYKVVSDGSAVVNNVDELAAALAEGGEITLANDITLTETTNITTPTNINLNGNKLTASVLEAKADTTISNGTLNHGKSTYPALSVSEGTLKLENVDIVCSEYCNLVISGSAEAAEYAGIEVWSGKLVMDNCTITVSTDQKRYSNSVFGIGIHAGEVIMNGGSITINNHGSTKEEFDYEAAIFAGSTPDKSVTLTNVVVNLSDGAKYLYAWGGHTTLNTTDNVTDEDVYTLNGGSCTIQ